MMLTAGMAMIERRARLRTRRAILDFSSKGFCSPRCGYSCAVERRRVFCGWFVPDTLHEHVNNMDGVVRKYKGIVELDRNANITKPMNRVGVVNSIPADVYEVVGQTLKKLESPQEALAGGYDSEDDPEALDSDDESPVDVRSRAEVDLYLTNHTL